MRGQGSGERQPGFLAFLLLALVLHAGLVGRAWFVTPKTAPVSASGREIWLSLDLEADRGSSASDVTDPEPGAELGVASRELPGAATVQSSPRADASSAPGSTTREVSTGAKSAPPSAVPDAATGSEKRPRRLSLAELGLGAASPLLGRQTRSARRPPGVRRSARPLSQAEAEAALDESLAQARLAADQRLGLGPEGPVLAQVVELARNETTSANSGARFDVQTNADGAVIAVRLVDSTTDPLPWRRILQALLTRLKGTRLRGPADGRGATFRIKVSVRAQLPSGADPGVAVHVAGLTLKEGAGPRSTRVDILNFDPKAIGDPERGGVLSIFSARGDLVDIGAPVQKVARAHVESIRVTPLAAEDR